MAKLKGKEPDWRLASSKISLMQLRAYVADALAQGRWSMPDDRGMSQLFVTCMLIQTNAAKAQEVAALGKAVADAKAHLEGFLVAIDLLEQNAERQKNSLLDVQNSSAFADAARVTDAALDRHSCKLGEMRTTTVGFLSDAVFAGADGDAKPTTWHDYVLILERAFVSAVATTNTKKLGHGSTGPLAMFIFKIIPQLTNGDPKTPNNVATLLKMSRSADPRLWDLSGKIP